MSNNDMVHKRLEKALEQMAECFVGTIHAFCGRLLRERPMEAGLDPQFREIDEQETEAKLNQHWDDYLRELREQGEEELPDQMTGLGVNVSDLRSVYLKAALYEDVQLHTGEAVRPDFQALRNSLFPMIRDALAALPSNRPIDGWDPLQGTIRKANAFFRNWDLNEDLRVLELALLFDRNLNVVQKRWPDKAAAKAWKEQFAGWRIHTLQPFLTAWREYLYPQLLRFVLPAVAYSRQRRMKEQTLSFQDLLMKAAELLRFHPEVRHYFAKRYTRLFIDEFQDTDPVQAEMMMLLTGSREEEHDWRNQVPKPGALFIVGDPKQSIYRFRRADISTYNFVKRMMAAHGDVLQLTRNFRSVHAIGQFVNDAFQPKFLPPGSMEDHQAAYVPMQTVRGNPTAHKAMCGVYTMTVPRVDYDRKADIAARDAERTARWIAWACRGNLGIADRTSGQETVRPARPDDFLILLRYREFIGLYAAQLERYGIAADTSGSQVMTEELRALHQIVHCLYDPTDRIFLLAVLRGMLYGVDDESLFLYTKEIGPLSLVPPAAVPESVSDAARHVHHILQQLRMFRAWVLEKPALAAFTEIMEQLGILPLAALQPSGAIRAGTLVNVLERIASDPLALTSWHGLADRLHALMQAKGVEGRPLLAGSGHAARIMNLHKAKGLEAPVVLLACPCGDHDMDVSEHIDRAREPQQGFFTITRQKDAFHAERIAQPAGWEGLSQTERKYILAEQERLLYVAATRAKQLLIVSRYPYKRAIDPWSGLAAALKLQPECEDVPIAPYQRERYAGTLDAEAAIAPWLQWKQQAKQATYTVTSITSKAKDGEGALPRLVEGRGMAFGTVIHACLEALGNGLEFDDLERWLPMAAERDGMDPQRLQEARAMLEAVIAGPVWQRAMKAKQRFPEFKFTVNEPLEGKDRLQNGVIDLVFEEDDGWVIVDFKTDQYDPEQLDSFVQFYEPQVAAYAKLWERSVGCSVKEAGLYFLSSNQYVRVR